MNCSWALVVTSFIQSCASQSGEPRYHSVVSVAVVFKSWFKVSSSRSCTLKVYCSGQDQDQEVVQCCSPLSPVLSLMVSLPLRTFTKAARQPFLGTDQCVRKGTKLTLNVCSDFHGNCLSFGLFLIWIKITFYLCWSVEVYTNVWTKSFSELQLLLVKNKTRVLCIYFST